MPGRQKSLIGTVVADKMEKTVVVAVETTSRHRIYHKIFKRTKRYMAHDDRLGAKLGDMVRILETRPLSRHKRWRVAEVLQRSEVAEVAPKEIDAELLERLREKPAETEPDAAVAAAAPAAAETPTAEVEAPAEADAPTEVEASAEAAVPTEVEGGEAEAGAAEATADAGEGASASPDSPESPESPDSPDSLDSPDSPEGPDEADAAGEATDGESAEERGQP